MFSNEAMLAEAIGQDNTEAFEYVFRLYYMPLCGYASGLLNDRDAGEEVVQQLFVRLWEKRRELQLTGSLRAYLFRAAHNAAMNAIKHEKVKQAYMQHQVHETPVQEQPLHTLRAKELEREIQAAVMKLPEQCRMVFRLSRMEELSYREIAEVLGISIKTVENQMGKALKMMRANLAGYLNLVLFCFLLIN